MDIVSNTLPERLYLSKGENGNTYINDCQRLYKSQIDGLRGLYNLFKKKCPGAILNNPADTGKTVMVALFIEAIEKSLNDPVLILCNDGSEIQYRREIILKWTKYTDDDIAIEVTNPYLKKRIFIQKSTELGNSFFRRNWSILVMKNDEMTKEVSKMVFNGEFKIWITAVDVFRDLKMLTTLGKFINPKMNINIEDFQTNNKTVIEKVKAVALLQAFTEDFVVRTENVKSILQKTNEAKKNIPSPITKKNKDTTGKKIKKTKRKLAEDTYNTPVPTKTNKKLAAEETMNESKCIKDDIDTNYIDHQDSPSVLNLSIFVSKNKPEIVNKINTEQNDNKINTDDPNDNKGNKNFKSIVNTRDFDHCPQLFSDHSTQSLTDVENENKLTESSQYNLRYTEDEETEISNVINTEPNITDDARDIDENKVQEFNKFENGKTESEVYERDTVDLNTELLQMSAIIKDVEMEVTTDDNQETGTNHTMKGEVSPKTEIVDDHTFDKKMNELEAQTLLKFKGSLLDSIF